MQRLSVAFAQLLPHQLYALLKLRQDVFVLEQDCLYPDLDDKDQLAQHLLMSSAEQDQLSAYARILPPNTRFKEVSIGRVVVAQRDRDKGLGRDLMLWAIEECARLYPAQTVRISAQAHLEPFYASLGFVTDSEPYEEDGIPHLEMRLTP